MHAIVSSHFIIKLTATVTALPIPISLLIIGIIPSISGGKSSKHIGWWSTFWFHFMFIPGHPSSIFWVSILFSQFIICCVLSFIFWPRFSHLLAGKVRQRVWVLAYFLATAAVLVPAPLIEFRYYTIPFYLFILHSHVDDNESWIAMGLMYLVINAFTMVMFLFRPFHWNHEPGVQRFIW